MPTPELNLRQGHTYTLQGKRINDVVNRMHVAMPKARDATARPPVIPGSVAAARGQPQVAAAAKRQTEKDLQVSLQESHTSAGGKQFVLLQHPLLQHPAASHQWLIASPRFHQQLRFRVCPIAQQSSKPQRLLDSGSAPSPSDYMPDLAVLNLALCTRGWPDSPAGGQRWRRRLQRGHAKDTTSCRTPSGATT